ncbi:alpha/beta fold hydrolase [Saccharothrix syringae]|uniref:Alpha/beta fold hydrolase n=1 Tax=Saccharothrix syringae TaxID=103733 RepID=A0A5Q0GVS3_SACSY|nr:alpha/beta fold hydrolase [Saccharothrix syringae]QFZ17452.1 alpha/beta fold hydrolase [Saccharothrix syringae]
MKGVGGFRDEAARARYSAAYERAMAECPAPDAVHDVDTRHGTTRVYRFGSGDAPPLVLLPGLMATTASLADLIPAFAAHHPVHAVDTLGEAGRSVQTAPLVDHRDRAACLDDVLDRLGLTGVHLVGGSTGGWHAVNQAIHAPDRLASISLLDPTAVTAGFSRRLVLHGAVAALVDREWLWRRWLRRAAGADLLDRPDTRLVLTAIRTYRARLPFQTRPAEDAIRSLRVPVLAVFAGRSAVHDPVAAADRLRAPLPAAEVGVLPELGHHPSLRADERDAFTGRVLAFIRRVTRERAPGPADRPPRASPSTG